VVSAMKRYMQPDAPEPIVEGHAYASALDYTKAVRNAYARLLAENAPLAEAVRLCISDSLTQRTAATHANVSAKTINLRRATGLECMASYCDMHPDRVNYELKNGAIRQEEEPCKP